MRGGLGDDTYVVDNAGDRAEEAASAGTDTVQSSITYTLGNNLENLTLTGSGVINGTGNTLNNVITGNGVANVLDGGGGNDSLIGGLGRDTLTGSSGSDRFVYRSTSESGIGSANRDVITDFKGLSNADRIDVSAIDVNASLSGDQAFNYIGGNAFTGAIGEARFIVSNGVGVLQFNTNRDTTADMEIALSGVTSFNQNFLIL